MAAIAMKDLLEAGVHFGHQTKRWNPKMKEYIFGERNGIYIIDLGKTVKLFREAEEFVSRLAAEGRTILFVGTKRQAQDVIAEESVRCGMYFVNQRWLGGLLTNFTTIQRSLARLRDLEAMETDGRYETITKKEIAKDVVSVGSKVRLRDVAANKTFEYQIVGSAEANPAENKLSNESPVGKALLGNKRGEVVKVQLPSGKARELKITKIDVAKK